MGVVHNDVLACILSAQCPNFTKLGTHGHQGIMRKHAKFQPQFLTKEPFISNVNNR